MNTPGLLKTLLNHTYKSTVRTGFIRGGWLIKIFMGFLAVYFLAIFTLLGFYLPQLAVKQASEGETVIQIASQYILYIIITDVIMRFFFQSGGGINLKHYVLQPVYYKRLIHVLLLRSAFNFFNLLLLLFIIPFSVQAVFPEQGITAAIFFTAGMVFLMLFNSFIADYLRRLFAGSLKAALIMILCFAAVFSTVLIEGFALTDISKMILGKLLASPAALLCIVLPAVAYKMNQQYLAQNRYGEMWKVNANTTGFLSRLEWS